ncbi:Fibrillarin [Artemisia annua]|uniref:Fibrillarin n=1 Tax=Artemisia annua TaxID=35608 RepID=A0A2U1LC56_ARTAN|nr:Fibrillarin [Artemisia annua]
MTGLLVMKSFDLGDCEGKDWVGWVLNAKWETLFANCIDSTVPTVAVFASEVKKLQAELFKPMKQQQFIDESFDIMMLLLTFVSELRYNLIDCKRQER